MNRNICDMIHHLRTYENINHPRIDELTRLAAYRPPETQAGLWRELALILRDIIGPDMENPRIVSLLSGGKMVCLGDVQPGQRFKVWSKDKIYTLSQHSGRWIRMIDEEGYEYGDEALERLVELID